MLAGAEDHLAIFSFPGVSQTVLKNSAWGQCPQVLAGTAPKVGKSTRLCSYIGGCVGVTLFSYPAGVFCRGVASKAQQETCTDLGCYHETLQAHLEEHPRSDRFVNYVQTRCIEKCFYQDFPHGALEYLSFIKSQMCTNTPRMMLLVRRLSDPNRSDFESQIASDCNRNSKKSLRLRKHL